MTRFTSGGFNAYSESINPEYQFIINERIINPTTTVKTTNFVMKNIAAK